eukprot:CAMPEP_0203779318 /NCGR_PEP_ID=MMETSP0099_2-20121227/8618_1 /ASSEMBLY_ACC=CAM_ASM_000209 /TAXON_ID=96639 /ORGANISM=" , Strain NY0313808BC1" /LENGTH=177 /DNA_ID=CAMNT_0050679189 /DNA_START=112 /DNA_END=645 /DNA_ORIENTATION=+
MGRSTLSGIKFPFRIGSVSDGGGDRLENVGVPIGWTLACKFGIMYQPLKENNHRVLETKLDLDKAFRKATEKMFLCHNYAVDLQREVEALPKVFEELERTRERLLAVQQSIRVVEDLLDQRAQERCARNEYAARQARCVASVLNPPQQVEEEASLDGVGVAYKQQDLDNLNAFLDED